jgi:hypothetical protein
MDSKIIGNLNLLEATPQHSQAIRDAGPADKEKAKMFSGSTATGPGLLG